MILHIAYQKILKCNISKMVLDRKSYQKKSDRLLHRPSKLESLAISFRPPNVDGMILWNLRSALTANLVVPHFQRKTLGGRAFPVAAAQA